MNKITRGIVCALDVLLAGTCGYALAVIGSPLYFIAVLLCGVSAVAAVLDV